MTVNLVHTLSYKGKGGENMTIKEVEQQLGLSRTTIRFYERENLITPKRDGNTYREYSEEDVAVLKKIVILRKLGFSIEEIKDFLEENVPLQELLEKNIQELQEKMNEVSGAIKICKKMQSRQEDFDFLSSGKQHNRICFCYCMVKVRKEEVEMKDKKKLLKHK